MSVLEHSFRRTSFTRTWYLRLEGNTLLCSGRRDIDLKDVRSVALLASPVYGQPSLTHRECRLKVPGRKRSVYIQSLSSAGVGEFDDRAGTYGPLVAAICQRVALDNPKAEFVRGSNAYKLMFYGLALFSGVFGTLMMIGGVVEGDAGPIVSAAILLFFAYITFSIGRTLTRETFDPHDPPDLGPFAVADYGEQA